MTGITEISRWFDRGVEQGASHMIVVCDTFDYEDYPVFVSPEEDARERANKCSAGNMQRVMEVYSLSKDKASQLNEGRSFNYD